MSTDASLSRRSSTATTPLRSPRRQHWAESLPRARLGAPSEASPHFQPGPLPRSIRRFTLRKSSTPTNPLPRSEVSWARTSCHRSCTTRRTTEEKRDKMRVHSDGRNRQNDGAQVVVLLALSMTVVLLCLALAADVGFAYVAKAKLSKAVDAACLTAMRNLPQGQATARTLATNS